MKSVSPLILVLLFATTLISCSKEKELDHLAGKWQLVETLSSGSGGSGQWEQVPSQYHVIIEFKPDGSMSQVSSTNGSYTSSCTGTYQIISNGVLNVEAGCSNLLQGAINYEKSNNNIIFFFQGRDNWEKRKLVYVP